MKYVESRYKEILFDKTNVLRDKLKEIVPNTGMAHSDAWFALAGEHFNNNKEAFKIFMDIPEMQEMLDMFGIKERVMDFGVHATKPGGHFLGHIHIDEYFENQGPVRILFPIWGYEDSYTLLYEHLGNKDREMIRTNFYGGDEGLMYQYYAYPEDDCELIERIPSGNPYFFNHRMPHDVEHNGPDHRVILWINFDNELSVDSVM